MVNQIEPKNIYKTAKQFRKIVSKLDKELDDEIKNSNGYIVPVLSVWATNCAFCLELYLKCLIYLERNEYTPTRMGHSIKGLFEKLSVESRMIIKVLYDMYIQHNPGIKTMEKFDPVFCSDFDPIISLINNAFERWRYSYEYTNEELGGFAGVGELISAVADRILTIKPEWKEENP